jgi:hypothetical protein
MSNELSVHQTITALYANILDLERQNKELEEAIKAFQEMEELLRAGFKKWAYHIPECMSIFTKEHKDCDCDLKEFIEKLEIK